MRDPAVGPPPDVLTAFGLAGPARPLPGGRGTTWRAAGAVLKPTGLPAETAWRAGVLATLPDSARFRVARPVRARDSGWTVAGWEAWEEVAGAPDVTRPDEILAAGEAFHAALAGLARPSFLDVRDDRWTYGDRVAWAELPVPAGPPWGPPLAALARARRVVDLPAQAVHGDLAGNVLFADGQPPAVIDWPVYFRPAAWAIAVAVVDLLVWHGAAPSLLDRGAGPEWDQMVVRALMYRMATNCPQWSLAGRERPEHYRPVVERVLGYPV